MALTEEQALALKPGDRLFYIDQRKNPAKIRVGLFRKRSTTRDENSIRLWCYWGNTWDEVKKKQLADPKGIAVRNRGELKYMRSTIEYLYIYSDLAFMMRGGDLEKVNDA